jgi:hypothetical protein
MPPDTEPSVKISMTAIYNQVQATDDKVEKLTHSVEQMVSLNKRLDGHRENLNEHGTRISTLETAQAIAASRPRAPWWVIVATVAAILTATATALGLMTTMAKIAEFAG